MVLRHHRLVQLVGLCGARYANVHPSALVQDNTQVLHEVLHVESRLEVSPDHPRAKFLQLEAARPALRQQLYHLLVVQIGPLRVEKCLTDTDHSSGYHDLVCSLCVLSGS